MDWTAYVYTNGQLDRAGRIILEEARKYWDEPQSVDWERFNPADEVMNRWRTSHSIPLNTFQTGLRRNTASLPFGKECLIAQRLKRRFSVLQKLNKRESMRLSQMQDIGGCRVIVPTVEHVYDFRQQLASSKMRSVLQSIDDYIESPQPTGYRSLHLMYKFVSRRYPKHNNLKIEVQIRSRFQHYWATAVETVDAFTGQSLKDGGGEGDWKEFFRLMGSVIARREGRNLVTGTPITARGMKSRLQGLEEKHQIIDLMQTFSSALQFSEDEANRNYGLFLLEFDPEKKEFDATAYKRNGLRYATEKYNELESLRQPNQRLNAVLVSVDNLTPLRKAYPNYFGDTNAFLDILRDEIG